MVLEKTLKTLLNCKEIKPVNPKGNQPWIFIGTTVTEDETPNFGHLMHKPTHWKRAWCWERLKVKGEGGGRGWDGWIASSLAHMNVNQFQETVEERGGSRAAVHGVTKSQTWLMTELQQQKVSRLTCQAPFHCSSKLPTLQAFPSLDSTLQDFFLHLSR